MQRLGEYSNLIERNKVCWNEIVTGTGVDSFKNLLNYKYNNKEFMLRYHNNKGHYFDQFNNFLLIDLCSDFELDIILRIIRSEDDRN